MILQKYSSRLAPFSDTPSQDARALLSCVLNCDPLLLLRDMTSSEEAKMEEFVARRSLGEPVAYITGEKEFMSLPFFVDKHTLIPRPDTETVVENIISLFKGREIKILDLCCGSGCIGISLAHYLPLSYVHMTDVSPEALVTAAKNIERNNLAERVTLSEMNVLTDKICGRYDLVVSNPPYIASEEVKTLAVSKYEPTLALDGGDDGLDFYRAIIPKAYSSLNDGGILAFEIGYDQGKSVPALMKDFFHEIYIKKDYAGNDRMVYAQKGAD